MKNILKFTLLALSLTGICDANAIAQITKRSNPPRSKVSKPRKKMPSEAIILRKVNAYLKAKKNIKQKSMGTTRKNRGEIEQVK